MAPSTSCRAAAKRVICCRLFQIFELPINAHAYTHQIHQLHKKRQYAQRAHDENDIANFLAQLDALTPAWAIHVQGQQYAACRVDYGPDVSATG